LKAPTFSAYFFGKRQHFVIPPIFWKAPTFCNSAYFSGKRQHFVIPPIFAMRQYFSNPPNFVAANICVYFQYLFLHPYY
jgi:hypothetical protein